MAELVDALASGASVLTDVLVQIQSRAPDHNFFRIFRTKCDFAYCPYVFHKPPLLALTILTRSLDYFARVRYNRNIFRRRDAPNGEIPKANLLFCYRFFRAIFFFVEASSRYALKVSEVLNL